MRDVLTSFRADETGATAIEYGGIASILSIAIATALYEVGPALTDMFQLAVDGFGN